MSLEFSGKLTKKKSQEEIMPKTANDLLFPNITLERRKKILENIGTTKRNLKDLESNTIFENTNNIEESRKRLETLIRKIRKNKLQVKCEINLCQNKVECCYNLCQDHLSIQNNDIINLLTIIRNIFLRLSFLEEQISLSLSNQLEENDLIKAIKESDILVSVL